MGQPTAEARTREATELLQALIRTACVNDGHPDSGGEARNADLLQPVMEVPGAEIRAFEPHPGRRSLLATCEGTDPSAPTLLLLGHTDVVPADAGAWRHDPFGGELVDGEVWGRGAIDMLNLTATMALAFRDVARRRRRPRGTLKVLAVADEEAGGGLGAGWLTDHHWDEVAADGVLTEFGGMPAELPTGRRVVIATGEKGMAWRRLTVRGLAGHGSMPYGADNAVVTAAEVVRRLQAHQPRATITDHWRAWVAALGLPTELEELALDPDRVAEAFAFLDPPTAAFCHAATHTTVSPNVVRGGAKTNVIPDRVDLDVDVRTLADTTEEDVDALLTAALGDLADRVEIAPLGRGREATDSPTDTPLYASLRRRLEAVHPDAEVAPWLLVGGTDAAFFRRRGAHAYGAGCFGPETTLQEFAARFHGPDERVATSALALTWQLWLDVVDDVLA